MGKIKRSLLLGATALAAMAFAGPATASAAEWMEELVPIQESKTIEMDGSLGVTAFNGNGAYCGSVQMKAVIDPGDKGSITDFVADPSKCVGFGPAYQPCIPTSMTMTNLPLALQAQENGTISTASATLKVQFLKGVVGCNYEKAMAYTTLTLIPDDREAFSSFTVGGSGYSWDAKGALSVTPAGIYGF